MTVNIVQNYINKYANALDSVASLINSRKLGSLGEVYLQSYYGGWESSTDGPKGGHLVHTTGGTATTPTVPPAVSVGTIGTGAQAGFYWDQDGVEWIISEDQEINSSMFGVYDNTGTVEMGAQLEQYFNYINNYPGNKRLSVRFLSGVYLITGSSNQASPGFGIREGLIDLLRDNLTLHLENVEFKVPDNFYFERTQVGGGDQDHFAAGLTIRGEDNWVFGGLLNGNLRNRAIIRGPSATQYGGTEHGFIVTGRGLRAENVIVKEWGSDCGYQGVRDGIYKNCEFIGARRLCAAVVALETWDESEPVEYHNCTFAEAGTYGDDDYNRPASGVDIESDGAFLCYVKFQSCTFRDNRKYNVQMSAGAKDCVWADNDFYGETQTWSIGTLELIFNSFNKQPAASGGHLFINNRFYGGLQYFETMYGTSSEDPSYIIDNFFETANRIVDFRSSGDYPLACWG